MEDAIQDESAPRRRLRRFAEALGACGMVVAMASDAIAVIGRHIGIALLGAIEIFQFSALVATASAIVVATLRRRHATVHILVDRLPEKRRHQIGRLSAAASALTFGLFALGSAWVVQDLWHTHEMTELLAIPLQPFRLFWIACAALVCGLFIIDAIRGQRA